MTPRRASLDESAPDGTDRQRLKVLLVGDYPPPAGGIAVHVQQLHTFLRERGVAVKVLDIGKGPATAPDVIRARSLGEFAPLLARHVATGWTVHLHTSGNNVKSWLLAGSCGVPLPSSPGRVVTLHSGLLPGFLAATPARRALARATLAGYSRVVAVSEEIRRALALCGVGDQVVVYPAFCASQVRPAAAPPGLAELRATASPLLCMADHPSKVYGRRTMLEALSLLSARHPEVALALFGPGTDGAEVAAEARGLGVAGRVHAFGELDHATALAVVCGSDVFVRPTTADGDSLSVREALALARPCVASDAAARPSGALVFRTGDPSDLARRIDEALNARPEAPHAPDAGPFLLELYQELLGVRRSAAPAAARPLAT